MSRARDHARRERWKQRVPWWYAPGLHLAALASGAGLAITWMIADTASGAGLRPIALLAAPLTLLLSLSLEYGLHRGPMHKRRRWGARLFVQHTLHHHRYFDHQHMDIGDRRELYFVLFQIGLPLLIFAGTFACYAGLRATLGGDVAMVCAVTIIAHYLALESIHLITHLPGAWFERWPLRLRLFRRLREHHRLHHDPRRMRRHNFSITAPFVDTIAGTRVRAPSGDALAAATASAAPGASPARRRS